MNKRVWSILLVMTLLMGAVGAGRAEIIPPYGMGQIGLLATVLCESLTVRQQPDEAAAVVQTLGYRDLINVTEQSGGWARCVLGDSEDAASGWVKADYIAVDPAWYRTEEQTPVYAWNDLAAPKIALLEANTELFDPDTFLPVLKDEGEWILVSLRGAAGWIHLSDGRQDGERFEAVILLEGMEETVRYEHVRSALGFEMDYDYESLERRSEPDRECFLSRYDDPANPENYLEVTFDPADADTAAAALSAALSKEYAVIAESVTLEGAGSCIRLDASEAAEGGTPAQLQAVYIIPAGSGSLIAAAHYTPESAEGFGTRFRNMLNTLTAINKD
ncbi:MAG: SH3 domain-containing protein [Clostridia bacterium]|nr:SH3 domain-containing protein [Clostridia bacterium]